MSEEEKIANEFEAEVEDTKEVTERVTEQGDKMEETELIKILTSIEDRAKSNTKRIDNLEVKVEDIHELATSVKLLASETKAMREDVNDMNNRLKIVEDKPLQEYEESKKVIRDKVIIFIATIILTYIAFKLGLKEFL